MIQRIVPLFTLFRDPQSFLLMTKYSMLVQTILFTGRKIKRVTFEVTSKEPFVHLNIYYDPEVPWHGSSDIMNMVYKISSLQDSSFIELLNRLKNSVMRANWDDQIQRNLIAQQLILSSFWLFIYQSGIITD